MKDNTLLRSKLIRACIRGPEIRAIGGIVYDCKMEALMSTTDLARIIPTLQRRDKIKLERQDSGGSPRWAWSIIK